MPIDPLAAVNERVTQIRTDEANRAAQRTQELRRRAERIVDALEPLGGRGNPGYLKVDDRTQALIANIQRVTHDVGQRVFAEVQTAAAAETKTPEEEQDKAAKIDKVAAELGEVEVEVSSPAILPGSVRLVLAVLSVFAAGYIFLTQGDTATATKGDLNETELAIALGFVFISFMCVMGYGTIKMSRK